jgi:hypothetical protein
MLCCIGHPYFLHDFLGFRYNVKIIKYMFCFLLIVNEFDFIFIQIFDKVDLVRLFLAFAARGLLLSG